jgi:hypothetical protein
MAKTLAEFKKEFTDLKTIVAKTGDEIGELEHNLEAFREHMLEGFNVLGARIAELRSQGQTGDKLDDYTGDGQVKSFVAELVRRREAAKVAATRADAIHKQVRPAILKRIEDLHDAVTTEISAREKKFSSKALGLNQSVKEMKPLKDELDKYKAGNSDVTTIFNFKGTYSVAQFDRLYTSLLAEQLAKTAKQVRTLEKDSQVTQALNDKIMKRVNIRAKTLAVMVAKQAKLGQAAHKAKDVPALSAAKTEAAKALSQLKELVAPYEKLMKNSKVQARLAHSPDKPLIDASYKTMLETQAHAEEDNEMLRARKMV